MGVVGKQALKQPTNTDVMMNDVTRRMSEVARAHTVVCDRRLKARNLLELFLLAMKRFYSNLLTSKLDQNLTIMLISSIKMTENKHLSEWIFA